LGLLVADADAKRLGGGSSVGKQRTTTPPAATSPAQQAPAAAPATPAPQPSGMSKWLGPLAGLAIGAGLASMFMGGGMGGAMGSILMVLAVVAVVIFAMRMLRPKPQGAPLEYAGAGAPAAPGAQPDLSTGFGGGAPATPAAPAAQRFPAGFDAVQFAHHAKLNFTKLQAANDAGDLTTMRDFMTAELYAQVEADIKARGQTPQKTDVVTLNAEVLEVVTEGNAYVASVNFSGMIREDGDAAAAPFSETWHLEKSLDGKSGWLISGIQQN
jgi:predicted lipid-binding transport protein (Tim44 family)